MKIILIGFLISLAGLSTQESARFDNYRVYQVLPTEDSQIELLKSLKHDSAYDFWTDVTTMNSHVDVMVPPHKLSDFHEIIEENNIKFDLKIKNVQELISSVGTSDFRARADFNLFDYNRLDVIYNHLYSLEKKYPNIVKTVVGGKSYQGRNITGVKVSYKQGNKAVFIEAGIHAREWIAPATVLYILDQLLTSTDKNVRDVAENYDWYIFPSFNPDGYEYTHTTNRLWRKTRTPYGTCSGVDPNRNWGYHWMDGGASTNPCSETYAGPKAFSEKETESMSKFITSIQSSLVAYIGFHSYSQYLLIPYGHTNQKLDNFYDLLNIGNVGAAALAKRYGTQYTVGNIVDVIYVASGGSMDWVKGVHKTPVTYTFELRDKGRYGFLLPKDQIKPTGEETLDCVVALLLEARKYGYK